MARAFNCEIMLLMWRRTCAKWSLSPFRCSFVDESTSVLDGGGHDFMLLRASKLCYGARDGNGSGPGNVAPGNRLVSRPCLLTVQVSFCSIKLAPLQDMGNLFSEFLSYYCY